jgi:hypothetical protein
MKKVLFSLSLLLLLGAGCWNKVQPTAIETVTGNWDLAFELPAGWVMVADYDEPIDQQVDLNYEVTGRADVVLQSIDKPIVMTEDRTPADDIPEDSYVLNEGARIRVIKLDPRRLIPSEAEDIGNGFYKNMLCEAGGSCTSNNRHNYDFYYQSGDLKYQFKLQATSPELVNQAIDTIMSAKVVTQVE